MHVDEVPLPELAPDEAFVAVMASSINFNTVWTSIFEPLPTFGFLKRLGRESVWGTRHDQPFHVIGSDAAGVVLRVGSAVRNWKPGDAVTVHCNHVDDQDPSRARRLDDGHQPAHLGLRDELRRPRRASAGEGEPADAEARAPHVGGGRGQRAEQLHELPHDREPERLADDAGPDGARSGARAAASARTRASTCSTVAARRSAWCRARRAPSCCTRWASSTSSTARPRASSSGRTSTRRTRRSGAGSARRSASSSAATSTSCSSTRVVRRWARRCSCARAAA